jgi:hypothetical protein
MDDIADVHQKKRIVIIDFFNEIIERTVFSAKGRFRKSVAGERETKFNQCGISLCIGESGTP